MPGVRSGDPARYPPREEDWRHFVRSLAARYKENVRVWEVWNEANIDFWLGTPEQYSDLLRQAYEEINAVDPAARVSVAGTAGVPIVWFNQVRETGGGSYMDIISVHPYRQPAPPKCGLIADVVRVRDWADKQLEPSLAGVMSRPIWITEMGYHTLGNEAAVSEMEQAKLLVRSMVQAFVSGVERFFWYEFAGGSWDNTDSESNFGLVYPDFMPKPGYVAFATMERMLGLMGTSRTLALEDRRIRAFLFQTDEEQADAEDVVVAWALDGVQILEWPSHERVTIVDIMGNRSDLIPSLDHRFVHIELSDTPVYIMGLDLAAMEAMDTVLISNDPLAVKDAPESSNGMNIVRNGGFEEIPWQGGLPLHWSSHISHGADFNWEYRKDSVDAPEGTAYMRLRNHTPLAPHVYGRIHQVVPVKPWTTYTIMARVRTQNNRAAWIGGGLGWGVRFQLPQDTHDEWEMVYGVFTTESEDGWELMVLLEDVVGYVDIDDIRIMEGIAPSFP